MSLIRVHSFVACLVMLSACNEPPVIRPDGPEPNRLALTGPSGASARLCSSALTLSARDSTGQMLTLPAAVDVTFAGLGSGILYSDPICTQPVTGLTLGPGTGEMRVYLKDPVSESLELEASVAGNTLVAARFPLIVRAAAAGPGQLDPDFGVSGLTRNSISSADDSPYAMAVDQDDRIYLAGAANTGSNSDFAVARFTRGGTVDSAFSQDGNVTQAIGPQNEYITAAAIQPDGRLLLAGWGTGTSGTIDFVLARYLPDGTLDPSFGNGGTTITPVGSGDDRAYGLRLLPDGRFLVVGRSIETDTSSVTTFFFTLVRYMPNGSLDLDFGNTGKVLTPVSNDNACIANGCARASAVGVQSTGRIVVAGYAYTGGRYRFTLTRYDSQGGLDNSFGTDGVLHVSPGQSTDVAFAMAIQPDNRIVVGGYSDTPNQGRAFAVARLLPDGDLDASFNGGTAITVVPGTTTDSNNINSLLLHPDGSIIGGGRTAMGGRQMPAFVRFTSAGVPDSQFGPGGVSLAANFEGEVFAIGVQTDGRVVFAAEARDTVGNRDFTVGRFWP
jgi:uncharacterized delta-60 repeat protein